MKGNSNFNERCIKGNATYFKIKIDNIIDYEINKFGANEGIYKNFGGKISEKFSKFSSSLISGSDFNKIMMNLRDEVITECSQINKNGSNKMRTFFKEYVFDKVYSMGINIKKGMLPEDCEQELEEARLKLEEEAKQNEEEKENNKNTNNTNNILVTVENEEEKSSDLVDLMFSYFFGSSKTDSSDKKLKKENKKDEKKLDNESKEKSQV